MHYIRIQDNTFIATSTCPALYCDFLFLFGLRSLPCLFPSLDLRINRTGPNPCRDAVRIVRLAREHDQYCAVGRSGSEDFVPFCCGASRAKKSEERGKSKRHCVLNCSAPTAEDVQDEDWDHNTTDYYHAVQSCQQQNPL